MTRPSSFPRTCDIFCRVVDNFGDIGVAWRLARQLAAEQRIAVRLVVDDLGTFRRLVPSVVPDLIEQSVDGVTVIAWHDPFPLSRIPNVADMVIETFACGLPDAYLSEMARCPTAPVWINLEYLSAESWVAGHHLLPSPHPVLPLTKYFFFPGFVVGTGGLIREQNLIARRDSCAVPRAHGALKVLVFGYADAPAEALFSAAWQTGRSVGRPVICRVPEGGLDIKLQHWRGSQAKNAPNAAPMLEFETLPFVPQADFDALLWDNDVLFVRGEDSFVRAQWAAKPFVWHVYAQADNVHMTKLNAFLDIYCAGLSAAAETAVRGLWEAWNLPRAEAVGPAWGAFFDQFEELNAHARHWSRYLSEMPDLVSNLLSFYGENAKIQSFAAP